MKIGDRVFVHGYVDEIRKDVVIIRNKGGYFGTDKSELFTIDFNVDRDRYKEVTLCKDCMNKEDCDRAIAVGDGHFGLSWCSAGERE